MTWINRVFKSLMATIKEVLKKKKKKVSSLP